MMATLMDLPYGRTDMDVVILAQDALSEFGSLGQWGQIGALIAVVIIFLKHQSTQADLNRTTIRDIVAENNSQRELDREALKEVSASNRQVAERFANSLDKNTEFLARNEKALETVLEKDGS